MLWLLWEKHWKGVGKHDTESSRLVEMFDECHARYDVVG